MPPKKRRPGPEGNRPPTVERGRTSTPTPTAGRGGRPRVHFRPGWYTAVGALLLLLGVTLAALNDLMLLDFPLTLLPGGHNDAYLLAGLAIAAYSTWWFGWFDRTR